MTTHINRIINNYFLTGTINVYRGIFNNTGWNVVTHFSLNVVT